MNAIHGWRLDPALITKTGVGLRRPECILHDRDGSLWAADLGGLVHIGSDGAQSHLGARGGHGGPYAPAGDGVIGIDIGGNAGISLPNGICFDGDDAFIVANFGTDVIERLGRDGSYTLILDNIDGRPLGKCNFPAIDSEGRLWFSVTASAESWASGDRRARTGYIAVIDQNGPRVVADNLAGTNEMRFDAAEEWLYVAETGADHISRFRVGPGATLTDREVYGPDHLGGGPDGFAFDEAGNIWTTLIGADRLIVLTPDGEIIPIWQDGDPSLRQGVPMALEPLPGDGLAPRMASITFGGTDMRTCHIGSLVGVTLPTFRSPIAGRPVPRGRWKRPD